MARNDDDWSSGKSFTEAHKARQSGRSGQGQVENGQIGLSQREDGKRLVDCSRLKDLDIRRGEVNAFFQRLAEQWMIVDDEKSPHARANSRIL